MSESGNKESIRWYYRPWVVLILLFLVLGPIGLPFLYKSPKFTKTAKVVLTLLVAVYTAYLTYEMVRIFQIALRTLSAAFETGA